MVDDFKRLLDQLIATGQAPPNLLDLVDEASRDPAKMNEIVELLQGVAGDLHAPLEIEDFYDEGDAEKFELRWPLSPANPLVGRGVPFEALDRKSQFFTLFAEWQRRETQGMSALLGGSLEQAEQIFEECLARADQIEVGELRARSYEGLVRVAERRGDREAQLEYSERAEAARADG